MNKTLQQVGIWVDTQEAHIVRLTETGATLQTVPSGIEGHVREPGQGKPEGRFGDQYVDPAKTLQRKRNQEIEAYLQDILDQLSSNDEVVLFGPAQMKHRLAKAIRARQTLDEQLLGIVTADKMTDKQTIAWVKDFYEKLGLGR
ncbi:MAG: hypothetical protein KDC54_11320 [Lewinella sp.]|nr:hypothetical protein [Lewinella sp.]